MSKNTVSIRGITTAAILLALATISTMVFKLVPMGNLSLLRFSLTPAIIIFASLILGPIAGAVVGVGSDLIPAVIAPTGSIVPLITLVYGVLGAIPWLLEFLTRRFRRSLRKPFALYIFMTLVAAGVLVPMFLTSFFEETFKKQADIARIIVLITVIIVSLFCCIGVTMANKRYEKDLLENSDIPSPYEIAIIAMFCEFFVMCMGKSLAFTILWGISYKISFYTIFLGLPINLAISVFATYWMLSFEHRFLHIREVKNDTRRIKK